MNSGKHRRKKETPFHDPRTRSGRVPVGARKPAVHFGCRRLPAAAAAAAAGDSRGRVSVGSAVVVPETTMIRSGGANGSLSPPASAEIPATSPASSSSSNPYPGGCQSYILHRVSKMDTLAGIAIKYGVEVADIRRLNGLVTDQQMFAHRSLLIPLPGRHPPSPAVADASTSNGEHTPPCRKHYDVVATLQSLQLKSTPQQRSVSPAMSSLQGYYGLTTPPPRKPPPTDCAEMAVYNKSVRVLCPEDLIQPREFPALDPLPGRHFKSRSIMNDLFLEAAGISDERPLVDLGDSSTCSETSVRRRQRVDAVESPSRTPELLLKEDSGGGGSVSSGGRSSKGLALRPKSGSRTDNDIGRVNSIPNFDPSLAAGISAVRKSSSTSNLQESEATAASGAASSIWPSSMWTLNPEVIARPIFDGLPKPMTARRKAALD